MTTVEAPRESLLATATEFAATPYDACYVGLAIDQDATLLTAERPTTGWVRNMGDRAVSLTSG